MRVHRAFQINILALDAAVARLNQYATLNVGLSSGRVLRWS
jgi:hypothetical protein